ncbi:hypothetical protein [Pelagicoccus sp. SDUM812005]|uniref:hypothetical protein n=1 Tax=Pelagicoccus sp. SDUM812005 TaxID=3041257 RepID=UPI00280E4D32|nr:hypothetical protein [Pelagicoccus sp. SDUM812005]MDQ8182560.1 hypothetical protein [Pelagicoccus sp. SDUM812005]
MKKTILSIAALASLALSSVFASGDHHGIVPPNGGRMIKSLDPQAEVYIADDGQVRVTFVSDEGEVISPSEQVVTLVGGDRMNPIRMSFDKKGEAFVSEGKLPLEKRIPILVQVQASPTSEVVRERFNLNLGQCPSCDYKEYACRCHDDEPESGHDH